MNDKRRAETSRASERARLERFNREGTSICVYALANLTPKLFAARRDHRLTEMPTRGPYVATPSAPRLSSSRKTGRFDPTRPVRSLPNRLERSPPSTVRREMTLLKRFVDFAIREHGLLRNALDKAVIDWPTAADERDVRLTPSKLKRLLAHSVHARPCRPRARGAGHVARRPRQRGGSAKLGADLAGLRRCRAGERGQRHRAAPRGACAGRGHSHEAADFAGHRRRPRSPPRSGARPARRHRPLTGNEGGNCRLLRQTRSRCSIGKPFDTRGLASIARTHFFAGAAFQT